MSKIIESEQELEKLLKTKKRVFVLFYASWCPFSMRFLPFFEKFSEGKEQEFFRVATDDMEACEDRYSVEVVPTIIYFENGKASKRLDGVSGGGLSEKQLKDFCSSCPE